MLGPHVKDYRQLAITDLEVSGILQDGRRKIKEISEYDTRLQDTVKFGKGRFPMIRRGFVKAFVPEKLPFNEKDEKILSDIDSWNLDFPILAKVMKNLVEGKVLERENKEFITDRLMELWIEYVRKWEMEMVDKTKEEKEKSKILQENLEEVRTVEKQEEAEGRQGVNPLEEPRSPRRNTRKSRL